MSLRKRARNGYPQVTSTYNETSDLNPSHLPNQNGDFILRDITLENIDQAVWETFNRRFTVAEKSLNLIPLDADVAALKFQNPGQFDDSILFQSKKLKGLYMKNILCLLHNC